MAKLKISPPDENSPGYLRRMKKALTFKVAAENGTLTPQIVDQMIEFLADFVIEPNERTLAIEALWDATEAQYIELIRAIQGEADPLAG